MSLIEASPTAEQPEAPVADEQQVVVETPSVDTPTPEGDAVPPVAEQETPVEHPSWFKSDKYESIEKQAEAYSELESKFGSFTGAPEDGVYSLEVSEDLQSTLDSMGMDIMSDDAPLIKGMSEVAKDLNMSVEGFNKFTAKYIEYQALQNQTVKEQTIKDLGTPRINKLQQWVHSFPQDKQDLLVAAATTKEGFEGVELLMNQLRNEPDLSHKGATTSQLTKDEIVSMQSNPEYKKDAAYRAKVSQAWSDFHNKS